MVASMSFQNIDSGPMCSTRSKSKPLEDLYHPNGPLAPLVPDTNLTGLNQLIGGLVNPKEDATRPNLPILMRPCEHPKKPYSRRIAEAGFVVGLSHSTKKKGAHGDSDEAPESKKVKLEVSGLSIQRSFVLTNPCAYITGRSATGEKDPNQDEG